MKIGVRHPIVFQVMVFIAAIILALVFSVVARMVCSAGAVDNNIHTAVGRLLAGGLLFLVFIRCFNLKKQLSGFVVMLPALLFAAWNIILHFTTGGGHAENTTYVFILGLAPAVFEEVLCRGIFIHNLKANGRRPMSVLLISAFFFGIVHMTNLGGGQHIINVMIQTGYAVVVGLVFGAIYIKTDDLISVIIAHAVIDISSKMFPNGEIAILPGCVGLMVVLAVETWYAFWLMSRAPALPESAECDGHTSSP